MKFVTGAFATVATLLLLAACYLPPVDVGLAVALSSAEQMTLAQSFSLWPNTVQDLYREAREVRFYPALTNSVVPAAGGPLGYFVVVKGDWVSLYYVQLDPQFQTEVTFSRSLRIDTTTAEPFHVAHVFRSGTTEEMTALYRYRPDEDTYSVIAGRNSSTGAGEGYHTEDIAAALGGTPALVGIGSYAQRFLPADNRRFAWIGDSGAVLQSHTFGVDLVDFFPGLPRAQATPPPVPLGFGRVVLADIGGETRTIVNVPVDNQFRTFVLFEETLRLAFGLGDDYLPLPIAGRLETVLATEEILTRTRDRFVVSGRFGETVGSFPAGDLRFVHEREIEVAPGDFQWHAVFTLTYWGRVDGDELLFVRVYVVPSAELGSLR